MFEKGLMGTLGVDGTILYPDYGGRNMAVYTYQNSSHSASLKSEFY